MLLRILILLYIQGIASLLNHKNLDYFAIQLAHSNANLMQDKLDLLQRKYNLTFVGRIGELDNYYLMASPKASRKRSFMNYFFASTDASPNLSRFVQDKDIHWIEHQLPRKRLSKRRHIPKLLPDGYSFDLMFNSEMFSIKDPGFHKQWHLINTLQPGHDLNVSGVWKQGITGKNITIAFCDDGLDHQHPDLIDNFNAQGSYDFNTGKDLPTPSLYDDFHGTRCAGEAVGVKNDACGVGIAWDAKASGIRILSGGLSPADEAAALTYKYNINHIYSNSWGPTDSGTVMEAPPFLVQEAIKKGIKDGRNGKGSIYVFASGNGGTSGDNCNYDGYVNSIYTIAVGAIDREQKRLGYSEACSANLVVTYSGLGNSGIYTSDWSTSSHGCTAYFGGTSAAAPSLSGVLALVLSIRPELSWRDVQYLIVKTAVPFSLDISGWEKVAKGRMYNHYFGFGVLNAYRIVEEAKKHVLLREMTSLQSPVLTENQSFSPKMNASSSFRVTEELVTGAKLKRLEQITVTLNIDVQVRGDVAVYLESPHGLISELLPGRRYDTDTSGFHNWVVSTVKHWDEDIIGVWKLVIVDIHDNQHDGLWKDWKITFFGESR